jgi:cytochrome c
VKKIVLTAAMTAGAVFFGCGRAAAITPEALEIKKQKVQAFVQKAADYAKTQGKAAALQEYMKKGGMFYRGELYIFAYDFNGTVISHGARPDLVGRNLIPMQDPKGVQVIEELIRLARSGQGWLEYLWPNPSQNNQLQTKLSYVLKMDESWFIGSGIYAPSAADPKPEGRQSYRQVNGLEWLQMSPADRLEVLVKSMAVLAEHGYVPDQTINDYYNSVSEKVRLNPSFYPEDVTSILETVLLESGAEPKQNTTLPRGL